MAISIGPKGYVNLQAVAVGPSHGVRIISFVSTGDTGPITHDQFVNGHNPAAIIDVTAGEIATSSFKTGVSGHSIRHQSDTGVAAAADGKTFWAIITDTGVAALT